MKVKMILLGSCAVLGILAVVLTFLGMSTFSLAAAAGFLGCAVVFLILRFTGKERSGKKAGLLPVILAALAVLLLSAAIAGFLLISGYGMSGTEFDRNLESIRNISTVISTRYGKGGFLFQARLLLAQYRLIPVAAGVVLMLAALGMMYLSDEKARKNAGEYGAAETEPAPAVQNRPAHTAETQNPGAAGSFPQGAGGGRPKQGKKTNQNMGPGNFMARGNGRPEQSAQPQNFGAPAYTGGEQNPQSGNFAPPDFGEMQLPESLVFQDFGMPADQGAGFDPSGSGMPDAQGMNGDYGFAGDEMPGSGFSFGQDAAGNDGYGFAGGDMTQMDGQGFAGGDMTQMDGQGFAGGDMTQMDGQGFPGGDMTQMDSQGFSGGDMTQTDNQGFPGGEGQSVGYGLPGIGITEDHCCVCGAPLTDGFAVLIQDVNGKEARIDENCCSLIETICSGTDPRAVSDAAAFLQGQQPLVDAAVADVLDGYIRSAAER